MTIFSYVTELINKFHDNFFLESDKEDVKAIELPNRGLYQAEECEVMPSMQYATVELQQSNAIISSKYYRTFFTEYLSEMGGLFLSILGFYTWVFSGYENFIQQKSMLKRLYRESDQVDPEFKEIRDEEIEHLDMPVEAMRNHLESHQMIELSYFQYYIAWLYSYLCCCCLDKRLRRSSFCSKNHKMLKKFDLANEALLKETDIQQMIKLNRLTRLLHKQAFLPRQRKALNY